MPAQVSVVLAQRGLELAPMPAAGVAVRPVNPAPVPGQPPARIGVDVLPMAQIEQLALERDLGIGIGPRAAELAAKDDRNGHRSLPLLADQLRTGVLEQFLELRGQRPVQMDVAGRATDQPGSR